MTSLLDLAERVERASGADRELDAAIAVALGWRPVPNPSSAGGLVNRWWRPDNTMSSHEGQPAYTASLDAAMTLIDKDTFFHVSRFGKECGNECEAHVYPNRFVGDDYKGEAATPALALCACALRARAERGEG